MGGAVAKYEDLWVVLDDMCQSLFTMLTIISASDSAVIVQILFIAVPINMIKVHALV